MNLFGILLLIIVVIFFFKVIRAKVNAEFEKQAQETEGTYVDADGHLVQVTETQQKWHKWKQEEAQRKLLEAQEAQARLLLEHTAFIKEHMRPFNFYEWILWRPVGKQNIFIYLCCTGPAILGYFLPVFFMGATPMALVSLLMIVFLLSMDLYAYNRVRLAEATVFNKEYQRRFVKNPKE